MMKYLTGMALLLLLVGCDSLSEQHKQASSSTLTAANYNVQLGIGYLKQGDMMRAKRKLTMAIQEAPHWPPALDAMGYYLSVTGDNQQAGQYYRRALALAPHSGSVQNNYGTYLCRIGEYQEAEKHFLLAIKDPDYMNTADAYENAGLCATKIPDMEKAINYFTRAVQQDPQRATSWLELSKANFALEQYQEANQALAKHWKLAHATPESLWLGYRIAKQLGYKGAQTIDASLLKTQFPTSAEAQALAKET